MHLTLRNSFTNKVGIQKLNQFRFELILQLTESNIEEIINRAGLTKKQIYGSSFHEEMSRKGKRYAEKERDLAMMNKIWSSHIICLKCPYIRQYLETMRMDGK
ncbi:hypothetical protein [Peribacillus loiseleuriae]|uniref:hypothetical protein n=1 Tax=Peribacillus loiseleuriae TaxID=1679170 RepID=UPI0012E237FD|nr:hypothetical protein [Peribacillus loiseleuriae]